MLDEKTSELVAIGAAITEQPLPPAGPGHCCG